MRLHFAAALAVVALSVAAPSFASPESIARAINDTSRPKGDRDADFRRLPYKTILFSGVKEGDVVGEFLPGGGYYTRMLSDVVGPKGKVYALETTLGPGQYRLDEGGAEREGPWNVKFDAAAFGEFNLPESRRVLDDAELPRPASRQIWRSTWPRSTSASSILNPAAPISLSIVACQCRHDRRRSPTCTASTRPW
jgi:hypothetical protein